MATIQGVYVALFGRPADPAGLAYFNTVTNNGANLQAIANLAGTQEYKDRFAGQNNVQIVSSIYQSLFNRAPEAAGLNFFVNALNTGSLNINNIAIAILDGAQGQDKVIADTKIASANLFTSRLDTPVEIGQYVGTAAADQGRAFLAPITTTVATAAQADAAITGLSTGNTITLGNGDAVVSLSGAAGFITTNNNDTINANTAGNLSANDKIDGGLGNDTLNGVINADVTVASLTSVENIFIDATADATFALTNASGYQAVWNNDSAAKLTYSDINLGTTLGVQGTVGDVATFTFKAAQVTGSADSASLALKGANVTNGITINAIETLNVVTSGTASTTELIGSTLKDVKISGDVGGNFTITADATLKTVDASALNGSGANITLGAASQGVTVTGSKFGETITLSTDVTVGNPDKDVVVYNSSNISTATQKDTIANFTTGEDKIDLKAFGFTSGTATIGTFGALPIEGSSFLGNAVASFGTTFYADTNKDGVFNAATDLQITITGSTPVIGDFIFS